MNTPQLVPIPDPNPWWLNELFQEPIKQQIQEKLRLVAIWQYRKNLTPTGLVDRASWNKRDDALIQWAKELKTLIGTSPKTHRLHLYEFLCSVICEPF